MRKIVNNILRIVPAVILLQTLFFKFTASAESVYIFETLGMEPYGRIASGVAELVAAVLLLLPKTKCYGAAMAAGIMIAAIASHLLILGIEVKDDGGLLFALAVIALVCCVGVIYNGRDKIPRLLK